MRRRTFIVQTAAAAGATLLPHALRAQTGPRRRRGIALVGLGRYSSTELAPALKQTRDCYLAGVVTGDPAKGRRWAAEFGFPESHIYGYDTMARLADNPEIEIVYVVTPNALHPQHVIAAAAAGKDVITEKPMATNAADCDAMIAACRKAGVKLAVGYRLHYEPHTREFIRIARTGDFGRFLKMEGSNGFTMSPNATPENFWRIRERLSGGGPLMDMGVYVIQACCMAQREAPPVAVTAEYGPVTMPHIFTEVEESIRWTMEFADGSHATCASSYAKNTGYFRATAERGWVNLGDSAYGYHGQILKTSAGTRHFPAVNQQALQLDGMVREWAAGGPSSAPGEMGRRDVAILEAIYASAKAGGRRTPVRTTEFRFA